LDVERPQLRRVVACEIGSQQIATLATTHLAQFRAIELELERCRLRTARRLGHAQLDEVGRTPGLMLGRTELHQQFIACERLSLQCVQALHVAAQSRRRIARSLSTRAALCAKT